MSKKEEMRDGIIVPEVLDTEENVDVEAPPTDVDGDNPIIPEEPTAPEEPGIEEDGVELNPEDAGCRAHGDTILTFPPLPEEPLVDYRAEVILNCFRNQPSTMEVEEAEEVSE